MNPRGVQVAGLQRSSRGNPLVATIIQGTEDLEINWTLKPGNNSKMWAL